MEMKPKKYWFLEGTLSGGHALLIKLDRFPFIVGRDKRCSLAIASKTISRRHSEIYPQGDLLAVRDLGSTNGTFVNAKRITAGTLLRDDDTISFADQRFRIFSSADQTTESGRLTNHLSADNRNEDFASCYGLSKREREVLFHLLEGKSTKKISQALFITEGTAKNHILSIFEKTGAHSRFMLLTMYNKFPGTRKK